MAGIMTRVNYAVKTAIDVLKKPKLGEISSAGSYIQQGKFEPYNPDDIVGKKGLVIYEKMRKDDTCKSGLLIKKLARLSTGWDIEPGGEEKEDMMIADFVKWNLTDGMKGTFRENIKEIYTALDFGFSITEPLWYIIGNGEWKNKVGLKQLKTRDPEGWDFLQDEHGNLLNLRQRVEGKETKFNPDDFIIFIWQREFDNYYGQSDLREAYRHWVAKDWILKFQNMFLERYGMGILKGTYPRYAINEKNKLADILDSIQAGTRLIFPEDVKIELMEIKGTGYNAFERAIKNCNTAIMRSLLVPDLLGFSEFTKGSYALGQKHFDVFLWVLEELGKITEEAIMGEQIIKPLIDFNFNNVQKYPQFKFHPITEDDKQKIAQIWITAVKDGAISKEEDDEAYLRQLLGFPEKKEEEEKESKSIYLRSNENKRGLKYIKKVNFKKIEREWNNLETNAVKQLSDVVKKMRDKLLKVIEQRQIVEKKEEKEIERLQISYVGDFKDILFNTMATGYLMSKNETLQELRKAGFKYGYAVIDEPLKPEEALKYFEGLPIKLKKELSHYQKKAFTIAGIEQERILAEAKLILYDGIRNDMPKETMRRLKNVFNKYLLTTDAVSGEVLTEHRLWTIVRTNTADAINQGRKRMFEEPEVKDDILAYSPSAVLDDSITDFCASIHGEMYAKETFEFPPYHYNCRTIVVAITRWELRGGLIEDIEGLENLPTPPGF